MNEQADRRGRRVVASIILCTCNRAEDLRKTLESMARVCVPDDIPTELVVVDNASTDQTADVIRSCALPNMLVRSLHAPQPGKTRALNLGMAQAQGRIFLFTDDDVRPPRDWIAGMCRPILSGKAHAVAGGVRLAPHLERPWMEPEHRAWLASTETLNAEKPGRMVGANMAFSREVLASVPAFDTELGPPHPCGTLEETLFTMQLNEAGYRIVSAFDTVVEHHCDESRLLRENFLRTAQRLGQSGAYVGHHWHHKHLPFPQRRLLKRLALLAWGRLAQREACRQPEGMPVWEMNLLRDIAYCRQYLIERKRPRNYEKHGLIKRDRRN